MLNLAKFSTTKCKLKCKTFTVGDNYIATISHFKSG